MGFCPPEQLVGDGSHGASWASACHKCQYVHGGPSCAELGISHVGFIFCGIELVQNTTVTWKI